jgi:fumarylacetoacetase
MVLNDWSARDIQKWEYVPWVLFSKKFCHLNIMVVTMDALEPFRQGPTQEPTPLPYLQQKENMLLTLTWSSHSA